ncbi:hypothetical protein HUJ04_000143 [Dendroctonus ponderosae]|nr:hypothetical protein HUJ04_000143 [Dendroctonus ponderosae]
MSGARFLPVLLLLIALGGALATIHGKYSGPLESYHLAVPHRATADGQFHSFHLPYTHAYDARQFMKRRKRELDDPEALHYGVQLDDQLRHLELWPNRDFLHPQAVIERRDVTREVKDMDVRGLKNKKMCYYMGRKVNHGWGNVDSFVTIDGGTAT